MYSIYTVTHTTGCRLLSGAITTFPRTYTSSVPTRITGDRQCRVYNLRTALTQLSLGCVCVRTEINSVQQRVGAKAEESFHNAGDVVFYFLALAYPPLFLNPSNLEIYKNLSE